VFDRDSRIDDFAKSALRVGAVFASSPNIRSDSSSNDVVTSAPPAMPRATPMFPVASATPEPTVEPSNIVVAKDVTPPASETHHPILHSFPPELMPRNRRGAIIAGACVGVAALVGVCALLVGARSHAKHHAVAASHVVESPTPPPPVEAATPPAATTAATAVAKEGAKEGATESAPSADTLELDDATAKAAAEPKPEAKKHLLGRLTIRGDAKAKNVWFDGKRMLGVGTRSFLVSCGMHTVAVNEKIEAKDIEIPCNGEYVVGR
jgi:hypothetical protein